MVSMVMEATQAIIELESKVVDVKDRLLYIVILMHAMVEVMELLSRKLDQVMTMPLASPYLLLNLDLSS